jgi:ribosomal protein S18 acetylase RimI-like enzyme
VRVEPATLADLDALADCWVALVADQRDYGAHLRAAPNRATARDVLGQYVAADGVLVARDAPDARPAGGGAGDLLGFVMFYVEEGVFDQDATRGVVENIYVRPDARSQGVGSRLLVAAEDALAADGASVVALSVMADNRRARGFYDDHGYEPHRVTLEKPVENDTHSRDDG